MNPATLCESVLQEAENRFTLVRLLDRMEIAFPADAPDPFPSVTIQIKAVIAFKSGGFVGEKKLAVKTVDPKGEIAAAAFESRLVFEGNEHGTQLVLSLNIGTDREGLYWLDVLLDEEMVTRIPLRLTFTRQLQADQTEAVPDSAQK